MGYDITKDIKLQDFYTSPKGQRKERPWRMKKINSLRAAESYERLGYMRYAERVRDCACTLQFLQEVESGQKYLKAAYFCHVRLCPMCNWRRSLKIFHEVSRVVDETQRQHPHLKPLFLTLTVRNCEADELDNTIKHMMESWRKLVNHRAFMRVVKGWFRALEVSYNKTEDTYHPHFHAILMVDKSYGTAKGKYIDIYEWVRLWRVSAQLDYDPVCDIRKVKGHKIHKAVAEVAKYAVKSADYLHEDDEVTDKVVKTLTDALHRKRLFAYGGILKVIAKELGSEKPDEGDLVYVDDKVMRGDVAHILVTYRWTSGVSDYVRQTGLSDYIRRKIRTSAPP